MSLQLFKGALTEQYVLQQIISTTEMVPYYYSNTNSRNEIDFLMQIKSDIVPIEAAAEEDGKIVGFLNLKETGKETVELAVMGVLKEYHRSGLRRQLVEEAKKIAKKKGVTIWCRF